MSRMIDLAIYECMNWRGIVEFTDLFKKISGDYGLLPIHRPPDGRRDSDWHRILSYQELDEIALDLWIRSKDNFRRWSLPHSPTNRVTFYFRIPILEPQFPSKPPPDARVMSAVVTGYEDGFVGIGISVSIGRRPGIEENPVSEEIVDDISEMFIDFANLFYGALRPSYLWVSTVSDYSERPGKVEIQQRMLSAIYWANFFGPAYVDAYDQSYLLNAPGWNKKKLDDGGVYLQLSSGLDQDPQVPAHEDILKYFSDVGIAEVEWKQ